MLKQCVPGSFPLEKSLRMRLGSGSAGKYLVIEVDVGHRAVEVSPSQPVVVKLVIECVPIFALLITGCH